MTDPDTRKLFVAGLSEGVSEIELRRIFEAAGASVEEVAVPRDRQTGKARGFGFITLASEDQAEQVRDALDGSLHDGRPISVRPFRGNRTQDRPYGGGGGERSYGGGGSYGGGPGGYPSRPPRGPSESGTSGERHAEDRENTLFLANLPGDCRDDELHEIFRDAGVGPILKLHLPVDPDGRRRGFGFVTLRDSAAAREAVPKLRERMLRGRPLTVDVARPRGERPAPGAGGDRAAPGGGAWRSRPPPPRGAGGEGGMSGGPPMRSFQSDAGGPPPVERQTWDERRDPSKRKKEASPKKKKVRAADRGHSRREHEGFRAPRARGLIDDWDEE
jgi:RNA recognition motif-containing protein